MRKIVGLCVVIAGCGSTGTDKAAATSRPPYAIAAAAESELPTCNAANKNVLAYVTSQKQFEVCDGSAWEKIDVATIPDAGVPTHVSATIFCTGGIEGMPLEFSYGVALLSSGDIFASADIQLASQQVSNSVLYGSNQNGALTASVALTADVEGAANGGWWKISLDRSTLITRIEYTDQDVAEGKKTWAMTADKCVKTVN